MSHERMVQLAGLLSPHQRTWDQIEAVEREEVLLTAQILDLMACREELRRRHLVLTRHLYDAITVDLIRTRAPEAP